MVPYDLTDTARTYAEQACYQDENIPIAEAGFRAGWEAGFPEGWKAARTHPAAQEPTDAERAVRELHAPREDQVLTGDCSIEACDHEDECPTVPFLVCTECWRVADESDTYFGERGVGHVAYPCPTIKALDTARAARRDEEKR